MSSEGERRESKSTEFGSSLVQPLLSDGDV